MNRSSPRGGTVVLYGITILVALSLVFSAPAEASLSRLRELATAFEERGETVRRHSMALLLAVQELAELPSGEDAEIIGSGVSVREFDQANAPVLQVVSAPRTYPVRVRSEEWVQIELSDGRLGWVAVDQVRVVPLEGEDRPDMDLTRERRELIRLAASLNKKAEAEQDTCNDIALRFDRTRRDLTGGDASLAATLDRRMSEQRARNVKMARYRERFFGPYAGALAPEPPVGASILHGVNARLTVDLGRTSAKGGLDQGQTSRRFQFEGSKPLDSGSELSFLLAHRADIIQTAFTTNDFRVGYAKSSDEGLNLDGSFAYQTFGESDTDANDYGNLELALRLGQGAGSRRSYADLRLTNRSTSTDFGNSYTGLDFRGGTRWRKESGSSLNLGIRGLVQDSDREFLDITRVAPNVEWIRRDGRKAFRVRGEIELLSLGGEADLGNFTRERLEFRWTRPGSRRELFASAKQLPNNEANGYIKLGGRIAGRKASLYAQATVYPDGGDTQVPFGDIRYDYRDRGSSRTLTFAAFARVWGSSPDDVPRDHVLDLYASHLWRVRELELNPEVVLDLRLGPILGAHFLYDPDLDFPRRDGNSYRVGFETRATSRIGRADVNASLRYEYNILYASEVSIDPGTQDVVFGNLVTRHPTSLRFGTGVRFLNLAGFDYKVDLGYYRVSQDVDSTTSLNPIDTRSEFSLLTGLERAFAF